MLRVLLAALLIGAASAPDPALAGDGPAYAVGVDGLACPFCAYGIEKQLSQIDGVETATTDIESGIVVVTMREGAALAEADVARAVEDAGFTLRSLTPMVAE